MIRNWYMDQFHHRRTLIRLIKKHRNHRLIRLKQMPSNQKSQFRFLSIQGYSQKKFHKTTKKSMNPRSIITCTIIGKYLVLTTLSNLIVQYVFLSNLNLISQQRICFQTNIKPFHRQNFNHFSEFHHFLKQFFLIQPRHHPRVRIVPFLNRRAVSVVTRENLNNLIPTFQ